MDKPLKTPNNFFHKGRNKDTHFQSQMKWVFVAFQRQPKSMLMASVETGILRANICRYVAKWREQDNIHLLKQGACKVSKRRVGFYTTNTELFPAITEPSNTDQLNLFE